MPKKTAHARSGVQRSRPKQKSFELVRPDADKKVLAPVESDAEAEAVASGVVDMEEVEEVEEQSIPEKVTVTPISSGKPPRNAVARSSAATISTDNASKGAATRPATDVSADNTPRSAADRLAARRLAAQKAQQRTPVSLISAEHYGYVRKDLVFILILAIIMFSAIIIMHFVPAIGG